MNTLQKAFLLAAAILVCIACNKYTSPTEDVDYYVKYSISDGSSGKVTYKIENGATTTVDGVSLTGFERTIGPVKKGDTPFVVKKEGVVNYGFIYKIDF